MHRVVAGYSMHKPTLTLYVIKNINNNTYLSPLSQFNRLYMRIVIFAMMLLTCISCKDKEASPIYTIVGNYHATVYEDGSSAPVTYPIADHSMSVKIVSETDSTVTVQIVPTPPKAALPKNVFVPSSIVYRNVLSVRKGTPTKASFYVNLEPIFGQPEIFKNAILFYSGTKIADYYYTPPEAPTVTRRIRLERD